MKLDQIETFVFGNPPPRHGGALFHLCAADNGLGVSGVGEINNATFGPNLCCEMAKEMFSHQFVGVYPHHIERLWRQPYGAGYTLRPDMTVIGVLSGLSRGSQQ